MTKLAADKHYAGLVGGIGDLLEAGRRISARAVNALMTATYWEIGRRIVEFEQGGKLRAEYGEELLKQLSADLTGRFGRGFGVDNLQRFRALSAESASSIFQTLSEKSLAPISATSSRKSDLTSVASLFPLPWSHYVRLLSVKKKGNASTRRDGPA